MLDFGALPPEINSGRMYSGAGSGSMLAASAAWDGLAAELRSAAASYGSVITGLTSGSWLGPASTSMAAAAAPYVSWMSSTAAQAEEAAGRTKTAVGAYEQAFAATVPPPEIAANRAQLMALAAMNFFGQNSPAIAATEARYGEMWAQDAAAMYSYAGASSAASEVTPFTAPPNTTDPVGLSSQAAAVIKAGSTPAGALAQTAASSATAQLVPAATLPPSLQQLWTALTASTSTTPSSALPSSLSALLSPNSGSWQLNSQNYYDTLHTWLQEYNSFGTGYQADGIGPSVISGPGGATYGGAWWPPPQPAASGGLGGGPMSASIGQAGTVGRLSVPPSWAAAPSTLESASQGLLGAPAAARINPGANGLLRGMPAVGTGLGRRTSGAFVHRYGFRHAVMPRPPSAG